MLKATFKYMKTHLNYMQKSICIGVIAVMIFALTLGCDSKIGGSDTNTDANTTLDINTPTENDINIPPAKPYCGDGICGTVEKSGKVPCPKDCGGTDTNEPQSETNQKCGDGTCGQIEKSNGICPQDCGDSTATSTDYNKISNISYATDSAIQKLDIYLPTSGSGPFPLILEVHGGAFKAGDKTPSQLAKAFTAKGYAVAALNYRLSSEAIFPAAIYDLKGAIRWLRANDTQYNMDTTNIGAIGGSAGGSLVALLGTSGDDTSLEGTVGGNLEESSKVQAVVDMFGPIDLPELQNDREEKGYNLSPVESEYVGCEIIESSCTGATTASALYYVSSNDPPFLILHGMIDNQIPIAQSERLYAALIAAGVDANIIKIPSAGHGGAEFDNFRDEETTFFDKYLK